LSEPYQRPHHQRIQWLLRQLNFDLLRRTQCYFGGGTAIVLKLSEYRESVDVDFLCASHEGYRELRNTVNQNSLGGLLSHPVPLAREVKADRYGIRTFCLVDGVPIKLEVVREDRITLTGQMEPQFPVPVLSQVDMFAEKLLANTDRWADRSTANRDLIDLGMMVHHWGAIPPEAWLKAEMAYGESVKKAYNAARQKMADPQHLAHCLSTMAMNPAWAEPLRLTLRIEA
jgi:predicted nucleotidyltransferase component of viral defense system